MTPRARLAFSLFGSAVEPAFDQILIFFLLKLSAVCTF